MLNFPLSTHLRARTSKSWCTRREKPNVFSEFQSYFPDERKHYSDRYAVHLFQNKTTSNRF